MDNLKKRFPRYSKLLYLYPAGYRREYGEQMLQTLADMLDDRERSQQAVWAALSFDFSFSVIKQQLSYTGATMAHETPIYVKRNALIGASLLVPFFLALIANGLDKAISNRTLYNSWLWHMPVLAVWVLWMPAAAAIIALASLLAFLHQRAGAEHTRWYARLFSLRHNWPILLVTMLSLGILGMVFFHDSVHCVTGNPVRELHNPHQTWQCIQRGSF